MRHAIICLLALFATGALATEKLKKPVDPNKRVCRTEGTTGSMLSHSVCHTRADWALLDAKSDGNADRLRDASHEGTSRPM